MKVIAIIGFFAAAIAVAFMCGCATVAAMNLRVNGDNDILFPATLGDTFAMAFLWNDGQGEFPKEPMWAKAVLTPVLVIDYIPSLATDALLLPLDLFTLK